MAIPSASDLIMIPTGIQPRTNFQILSVSGDALTPYGEHRWRVPPTAAMLCPLWPLAPHVVNCLAEFQCKLLRLAKLVFQVPRPSFYMPLQLGCSSTVKATIRPIEPFTGKFRLVAQITRQHVCRFRETSSIAQASADVETLAFYLCELLLESI